MNRKRNILILALISVVILSGRDVKADFVFGEPENLGPVINSAMYDSSAMISPDGLSIYFARQADWSEIPEVWMATRATKDAQWDTPVSLGMWGDNCSFFEAIEILPGITTADGLEIYFGDELSGGYGSFDLWGITRESTNADWSPPINLGPVVNGPSQDIAPSISPDGLELYFSGYGSTLARPGGSGGADLWVTKRATREDPWTEPVNLGPTVNSPLQDARVCISADGLVLLFDSQRTGGHGSADLYMIRRASISAPWGEPVNLGPIINSPAFDECAYMSADGSTLFFDSARTGGYGGHDIWQVSVKPVVDFNGDDIVDATDICIMVDNWGTDEPLCDIGPMPWGDGIVDVQDLRVLAEHLFEDYRLIAHWKLDETEGDIAYDSISSNDGTCHGEPVWQPAGGKIDGALQFDGADDYISTPFILNPAEGPVSVFAWIKGGGPGQVIICQTGGSQVGIRWLWADPSYGRLLTWLMHPPFDPLVSESVITDGQWHHVGLVYDYYGLHRSLYVDGIEVAKDTTIVGGESSEGDLYFGAGKDLNPGSFFSGLIDDVQIYNEALSPEEVAALAH